MRPCLVGILNVTPDSFYDGGEHLSMEHAIEHAFRPIEEGADVIDVGGESTRPDAQLVSIEEECARVIDVVSTLAPHIPVSIDTTKPIVAQKALLAGATILNDVQGLQNPALMELSAHFAEVVIMHSRGTPKTMRSLTDYDDVIAQIHAFFAQQIEDCRCPKIWLDPGIGFAKTAKQSIHILNNISAFSTLEHPIYIGASRKSFIPKTIGIPTDADRLPGSLAAVATTYRQGANAFRVHDVAQTKQFLDMLIAIEES